MKLARLAAQSAFALPMYASAVVIRYDAVLSTTSRSYFSAPVSIAIDDSSGDGSFGLTRVGSTSPDVLLANTVYVGSYEANEPTIEFLNRFSYSPPTAVIANGNLQSFYGSFDSTGNLGAYSNLSLNNLSYTFSFFSGFGPQPSYVSGGAVSLLQISPVPEPTTYALMVMGLGGMLLLRRRP